MIRKKLIYCVVGLISFSSISLGSQRFIEEAERFLEATERLRNMSRMDYLKRKLPQNVRVSPKLDVMSIDFSRSNIFDKGEEHVQTFNKVLAEIKSAVFGIAHNFPDVQIHIDLKDNYLTGVKPLKSLLEDVEIKENVSFLNLSNNRLTEDSLPDIVDLLRECPKLRLDISVNLIGSRKLNAMVNDPEMRSRVTFSAF